MDIVFSMLFVFFMLIFSIYKGIFIGYPLVLCFLIFIFVSYKRGFLLKDIMKMSYNGGKKAFIVLRIFILIGSITAIWMASGTVPGIVYYGIKFMNPTFFILYSFLISSFVSFLLGTSFGTVSTVGIALIVMAKGGNINLNIVAGAIIAGAYFGDRCSPMSSSANLVAHLTETNFHTNFKNMFKTSAIPFVLSIILYTIFSLKEPFNLVSININTEILNTFYINWIVLLPAITIIILAMFKVDVKISMIISILVACVISIIFQHYKLADIIKFIFLGFKLDAATPLQNIIKGGGIISMLKPSLVVFISCSLAGIFDGTNMLKSIEDILMKGRNRFELFLYTTITSIITAAFGCNQSIAIVLTSSLMKKPYNEQNVDNYKLAIDLENTAVVLSALIPWNIAAFVPTTTMDVNNIGYIPYAFYLYLIPICNIIYFRLLKTKTIQKTLSN